MPDNKRRLKRVAELHGRLVELCDSGFALAVHIRFTRPTLLYRTYAAAWIDHYSEKGFMMADPTVHWGLANTGSMDWVALAADDPEGVIKAAGDFGLINGWTYSTGPANSRSLASMTSSTPFTKAQRDDLRAAIDEIHALTDGFDQFDDQTQSALRDIG